MSVLQKMQKKGYLKKNLSFPCDICNLKLRIGQMSPLNHWNKRQKPCDYLKRHKKYSAEFNNSPQ